MDINVCPTTAFSLDTKSPEGPVRELNPGPLAPEARIITLDQQATGFHHLEIFESSPTK